MAKPIPRQPVSVDEYLEGELGSEIRHEYLAGGVYATSGASDKHNLICLNLAVALHQHLRGGPCQLFMADVKVRLRILANDYFYYPDIMVCCRPNDRETHYREQPSVLVEVLSDSTERVDRREKLLAYQHLESLAEYVLIAQDRHEVTVFRRSAGWAPEQLDPDGELALQSLKFRLVISEIYAGVDSSASASSS